MSEQLAFAELRTGRTIILSGRGRGGRKARKQVIAERNGLEGVYMRMKDKGLAIFGTEDPTVIPSSPTQREFDSSEMRLSIDLSQDLLLSIRLFLDAVLAKSMHGNCFRKCLVTPSL